MLRAILQAAEQRLDMPLDIDKKTALKRESPTVAQVVPVVQTVGAG